MNLAAQLYKAASPKLASTPEDTFTEGSRLVEHPSGPAASGCAVSDHQGIEYLRAEVIDRLDAQPFEDWSPALLRALIAVFDLNGVTPAVPRVFRPHIVR
ncbi:hypothetical protein HMPREF0591_0688 [Mycobacterium parascrofulaceum ATCC BAA-614]|uniref:Uncharacterized protein n=1 Tax=Mycobacterium parascrofulaceum ATCC BAA-614 TaxID=525368 RepID=D5P3E4_9MYCO|nr:hypothetical protein HMPREF0591_0688 [Mycobacterium parascrofulaceum ATCC BAA-614]